MKRTMQILVALVGMLLISFAVPSLASAEQCSLDGKICLVTDTSQPLVPPTNLQFKVTSEATSFGITGFPSNLIEQGPPDGVSLWQSTLNASMARTDSLLVLRALAGGPHVESEGVFSASVLAPTANPSTVIRRSKKRVVAIYRYEGRTTVKGMITVALNAFDTDDFILLHRGTTMTTGPGPQVLKVALPQSLINRKCKTHPHCSVIATGRTWSGEISVDGGTSDRLRVK